MSRCPTGRAPKSGLFCQSPPSPLWRRRSPDSAAADGQGHLQWSGLVAFPRQHSSIFVPTLRAPATSRPPVDAVAHHSLARAVKHIVHARAGHNSNDSHPSHLLYLESNSRQPSACRSRPAPPLPAHRRTRRTHLRHESLMLPPWSQWRAVAERPRHEGCVCEAGTRAADECSANFGRGSGKSRSRPRART